MSKIVIPKDKLNEFCNEFMRQFTAAAGDPAASVEIDGAGWVVATQEEIANSQLCTIYRWALRAIADDDCRCADDELCPACFAKSMLEPMNAERIEQIFNVPLDDSDWCRECNLPADICWCDDDPDTVFNRPPLKTERFKARIVERRINEVPPIELDDDDAPYDGVMVAGAVGSDEDD